MKLILKALETMRTNRLGNYIVPGVASYLIGDKDHGLVRIFHSERDSRDTVTPHSHRFDFSCLAGEVKNTIWYQIDDKDLGEAMIRSTVTQVCGADGVREFVHTRE